MAPIVEVAFTSDPLAESPVWTDVTRWVQLDPVISVQRGAADELSTIQAGTLQLTLDNTDARFTPGNPASPYYPHVRKGRRVRVRVVHVATNYVTNPLFEAPDGARDWRPIGPTQADLDTDGAHYYTGAASLVVTLTAADGTDQGAETTLYGLDIGEVYTANHWVYVPAGVPALRLGVAGLGASAASVAAAEWVRLQYTFTATDTTHVLQVTPVAAPADGAQVWIDQVLVNAGPTRAPFDPVPAVVSDRYSGFVNRWPPEWPGGGALSTVTITCSDVFKRLAQVEVASMLEEEIRLDQPRFYFPLSEPSTSDTGGDVAGRGAGPLVVQPSGTGGVIEFGFGDAPPATGLSAPRFTPVDAANGLYLISDLGGGFEQDASFMYVTFECWFSTEVTGRVLAAIRSYDGVYETVFLLDEATGRLRMESYGFFARYDVMFGPANLADGAVHHMVYSEVDGRVWIDGVDVGTQARSLMYRLRMLVIGSYTNLRHWVGSVSHVAAYLNLNPDTAWVRRHHNAGRNGFAGEAADARIRRIAGYIDMPTAQVTSVGTAFGPIASQGAGRKSPLTLMQEVEATESAHLVAGRGGGLVLQGRDVRYGPVPVVELAGADLEGPPEYTDDDQMVANEVRVARPGGATTVVTDPASIAAYGRFPRSVTVLKTTDTGALEAAQWHLNRYADPAPRLRSLPVEGYTLGTDTYRALLAVDISSTIALTDLPRQAPAPTDHVTVEGYTEEIGRHHHLWRLVTSPADLDRGLILDDPVSAVLDDTAVLAY